MSDHSEPTVRRRRVFYVPGYDPYPPRRYRELYRSEAGKQAAISGYRISVRSGDDRRIAWEAAAEIDGIQTLSRIEVLEWSDIVRGTMDRSLTATYLQLLHVAWVYIGSGALRRLMMLRKGPILAGFYPVLMLLAQLSAAALLGKALASLVTFGVGAFLGLVATALGMTPGGGAVTQNFDALLGWAVFGGTVWAALRGFRAIDDRLYAHYLMHDLAYTVRNKGAYPPELAARIAEFSQRIGAALKDDRLDEVLVVGHSSGAQLAVSAVAGTLRDGAGGQGGPALSLLTLGQAIPMVSFLPDAHDLRRDLHDLCGADAIAWVDVSAPGDGCCFALCDPVGVTGVAPETPRWPLVVSAAFTQTLKPETLEALKGRFLRLHFQYLCAFDRPKGYDYFQITAGPRTLGARFAGRKPSVSRIDVPASGFRSMAA